MSTPPPPYTPPSPSPTNLQYLRTIINKTRVLYNQHKRLRTLINKLKDLDLQMGELQELDILASRLKDQGYDHTLIGVEATSRELNGRLRILERMELEMRREVE